MTQSLRDYQLSAIEQLRDGFRGGKRRQVLVAPTGAGKTTIAAHMIAAAVARGRRVVFVAHRKELIDQASKRLDEHGVNHGVVMASHPRNRPLEPVQVCSIATLTRRNQAPPADLLIIDECHHQASAGHAKLAEQYPQASMVGLTATPWRLDGKGLAGHFDGLVVAATPAELIKQGHLVNYVGYRYESPDLSQVRTKRGDYDIPALELACNTPKLVGNIVSEWLTHASQLRTILFAVNIEHAKMLAAAFIAAGAKAECVDYTTGPEERAAILARVSSGETRVICNVALLCEGVDIPALECVVLARPTKSLALYLQQVGRVLRTFPDKNNARIHDHAGLVEMHGLPDAERDYSLTADRKSNKAEGPVLTTCPECFAIFKRDGDACPQCGVELKQQKRHAGQTDAADGEAVDIRAKVPAKVRDAWLEECVTLCIQKGYKPGWLVWRHEQRFPGAPKPWGAYRKVKQHYEAATR